MGVRLAFAALLCASCAAFPALAQKSAGEAEEVRFIGLHGGLGKGTVFVYILPR